MHAVEHYELIRRKHFVDGMSQRAIAEELGHSRKFVRKALEHPIPPGYRLTKPKPKPTLDPVRPLIDAWLEEDLTRPVKQRHTAQRIYERLVEEEGFQGDPSTIRRYVAGWKQARNSAGKEVFAPLEFRPGEEAQVRAQEELLIHTGNAGGMTLLLNNRKGKPLGSSGEVVRDVRITLDNMEDFIEKENETA